MSDVVLVHAGVADSRMWSPQLRSFAGTHRVVAPDLPGFGTSPYDSNVVDYRATIRAAMDAGGMKSAAVVGTSLGGTAALELALESPERVAGLVLVGAGVPEHEWSDALEELDTEETTALERGDLDAAVAVMLRAWVAGPRRNLDDVDPEVCALVAEMQRRAYELQEGRDDVRASRLEPPASTRLHEVSVPTLVLTGAEDFDDFQQIADRFAREIPDAERATIAGAAHLPNLERPDEFDRLVLGFLERRGL